MGNGPFSTYLSTTLEGFTNPEVLPSITDRPKYDPNFGFSEERQPRGFTYIYFSSEIKTKEEDLYWARIEPNKRDYCAQYLVELARCRKQNYPFLGVCAHTKHEWDNCQNEDALYRMKEFERERRLRKREQRKRLQQEHESLPDA